jgi:hypothetical protein
MGVGVRVRMGVFVLVLVGMIVRMIVAVGVGLSVRVRMTLVLVAMMFAVVIMTGRFCELAIFEDIDLGRADAAAVDVVDAQLGSYVEGVDGLQQEVGRNTGVDEGSKEHIPADACEAFEISDTHRLLVFS